MNKTLWLPGVFFKCGDYYYTIQRAGEGGYFGEVMKANSWEIFHTTPTRKKVITVHRLCSRWVSKDRLQRAAQ